MKIYLDLVLILNFFFDFLLLFAVNHLLKRKVKFYRIILGSLIGSLSILILFISINSIELFILKIVISILMILITFGYNNRKVFLKNIIYLYLVSIILGGSLYLLNDSISYNNKGIIFFNNGLSINIILMIIISPVIMYYYLKQNKNYKLNYSNYHDVVIHYNNKEYIFKGYLDTGNNLYDPYKRRAIILLNKNELFHNEKKIIYVPYQALNISGVVKCIKVDKIYIDKKEYKNILIGESINKINIDNIDCLLPNKLREELC